jgi:hypothetical protein
MVLHVPRRTAAQAPVPSKLNCPACVPTRPATVTAVRLVPPPYDAAAHLTVVAVIHEAVLHCAAAAADSSSDADGVGSIIAKFCPLMVTDAPPVCAAFAGLLLLTAGAAHTKSRRSWCCTSHGAQPRKHPYRRS